LPAYPPLPEDLVEFAHGGRSLLVGTCNKERLPDCVRAMGVRVWPDACRLTVILPAATGATSIANLRDNPKIALTLSHIPTHRTIQIKGKVLAIREGTEEDRELAIRYRELFIPEIAWAGMPATTTRRLGVWPCFAIDVEIDVVFSQTPGPVAGAKMPLEGAS